MMFGRKKKPENAIESASVIPEASILPRRIVEPTPEWLDQLEIGKKVKFVRLGETILAAVLYHDIHEGSLRPKHMDMVQSRPDLDGDIEDAGFLRLDGQETVQSIAVVAFSTIYLRGNQEQRQRTVDILQTRLPDIPITFDDDDLSMIY